jgi:hypothetical protein
MCTTFTVSDIVLIITASGGVFTGLMMALRNTLKSSSCLGAKIEFEDATPRADKASDKV